MFIVSQISANDLQISARTFDRRLSPRIRHTDLGFWACSGIYPWPFVQWVDGRETPNFPFAFGSVSTSVNVTELVTAGNVLTMGNRIN